MAYTGAMPPVPDPHPSLPGAPARPPRVRTEKGRRTLEFVPGDVQSAMLVDAPDTLVLSYCRAIMCFALFVPRPRHIVMVGLGGGSLAKFCYRHFPATRITVLELRADVIALRRQFCIPDDDARFQVVQADAVQWMADKAAIADVLIVDGFDEGGLPGALGSARFYGDCRRALEQGGVLCANIFSYDPAYPGMLARLGLMFDNRVCWFNKVAGNNRILFAVKAPVPASGRTLRALRVQRLVARGQGLGAGILNRWFARALVARLARRTSVP